MPQLEGRNPVLEALSRGRRRVEKVWLDSRCRPDEKLDRLLALCQEHGVSVKRVERAELDRMAAGDVHNGVIAQVEAHATHTVATLLDSIFERGEEPFLLVADEIVYEQNLGAILRSAMGAGVHGVVIPVRRGKGVTPVVSRIAMGGAEEVVVVREGIPSALKQLRKAGVHVIGADMGGEPYWGARLTGAVALVLGGESKGLSSTVRERCDRVVSVPLENDLESLNVSVTAGILLFERLRQQRNG